MTLGADKYLKTQVAGVKSPAAFYDIIAGVCYVSEVLPVIISGKQIQSIMKVYTDQNKVTQTTKTTGTTPASKKDEVILSTQAQEFGQIFQAIKAMPDVRQEKVQEIANKIAQGDYSVDAREVAEKMLGRMLADNIEK